MVIVIDVLFLFFPRPLGFPVTQSYFISSTATRKQDPWKLMLIRAMGQQLAGLEEPGRWQGTWSNTVTEDLHWQAETQEGDQVHICIWNDFDICQILGGWYSLFYHGYCSCITAGCKYFLLFSIKTFWAYLISTRTYEIAVTLKTKLISLKKACMVKFVFLWKKIIIPPGFYNLCPRVTFPQIQYPLVFQIRISADAFVLLGT